MAKNIQLNIPEPCHENWDDMTQADKGRFCVSCQKQVVDFSKMSDREIAQFFKKPSTGSVCGRFMQDQLNRDLEIPRKRIPWIKYFFQFALPAFLFSVKVKAQGTVRVIKADTLIMPELIIKSKAKKQDVPVCSDAMVGKFLITTPGKMEKAEKIVPVKIKGQVVDENNDPVPFASVMIQGTANGVQADKDGWFKLNFPKGETTIELTASSVGFAQKTIGVEKDNINDSELRIQLVARPILDEVVVVTGYNTTIKGMVLGGAYSVVKKQTYFLDSLKSFFTGAERPKAYPNPVKRGATLNIEWNQPGTGNHFLQIIGQGGQLVYSRQLWIDADARVLNLEVPSVAAGTYFLRMTHSGSGKSFTEKIIIQ